MGMKENLDLVKRITERKQRDLNTEESEEQTKHENEIRDKTKKQLSKSYEALQKAEADFLKDIKNKGLEIRSYPSPTHYKDEKADNFVSIETTSKTINDKYKTKQEELNKLRDKIEMLIITRQVKDNEDLTNFLKQLERI